MKLYRKVIDLLKTKKISFQKNVAPILVAGMMGVMSTACNSSQKKVDDVQPQVTNATVSESSVPATKETLNEDQKWAISEESFKDLAISFRQFCREGGFDISNDTLLDTYLVANLDYVTPRTFAVTGKAGIDERSVMANYLDALAKIKVDCYTMDSDTKIVDYSVLSCSKKQSDEVQMVEQMLLEYNQAIVDKDSVARKATARKLDSYFQEQYLELDCKNLENHTIMLQSLMLYELERKAGSLGLHILDPEDLSRVAGPMDICETLYNKQNTLNKFSKRATAYTEIVQNLRCMMIKATDEKVPANEMWNLEKLFAEIDAVVLKTPITADPDIETYSMKIMGFTGSNVVDSPQQTNYNNYNNYNNNSSSTTTINNEVSETSRGPLVIADKKPGQTVPEYEAEKRKEEEDKLEKENKAASDNLNGMEDGAEWAYSNLADEAREAGYYGNKKPIYYPSFSGKSATYINGFKQAVKEIVDDQYADGKREAKEEERAESRNERHEEEAKTELLPGLIKNEDGTYTDTKNSSSFSPGVYDIVEIEVEQEENSSSISSSSTSSVYDIEEIVVEEEKNDKSINSSSTSSVSNIQEVKTDKKEQTSSTEVETNVQETIEISSDDVKDVVEIFEDGSSIAVQTSTMSSKNQEIARLQDLKMQLLMGNAIGLSDGSIVYFPTMQQEQVNQKTYRI